MTIEEQINAGIKEAMKSHDKMALSALRNAKKVLLEVKTAPGAGDVVTDDQCLKIFSKLVKQGEEAAAVYRTQNREDLYEEEMAQVEVYRRFLPQPLSPEELENALREVIRTVGADSVKDFGKVMGVASKTLAGRADGKDIAAKVKELLS